MKQVNSIRSDAPRLPRRTLLGGAAIAATALTVAGCAPEPDEPADLVIVGGRAYTLDKKQPWAEAVAVRKGRIQAVGDRDTVEQLVGAETEVIDANGGLVLPGFHDLHVHAIEGAQFRLLGGCELPPDVSLPELLDVIRDCVASDDGDWFFAYGYLPEQLAGADKSPRDLLDELIDDRPALILDASGHTGWANSLGLGELDFDDAADDPTGGVIRRDEHGEPDGFLYDNASLIALGRVNARRPEKTVYKALLRSQRELARNGITSMADAHGTWRGDKGALRLWKRAEKEGALKARVTVGLWSHPEMDDDDLLPELVKRYRRDPDRLLNIAEVKIYADGITTNTTAAFKKPYEVDTLVPHDKGLNYFDQERMTRAVTTLEKAGFNVHIHAIGDRGVHEALNAIAKAREANGDLKARHRLTHVVYVSPEDVPRFAELDVIADIQTSSEMADPDYRYLDEPILGRDRIENEFLMLRALVEADATVTLSSDWPVGDLLPTKNIQRALLMGDRAIPSLKRAIRAYTIDAARALRQEDLTGSLEVGKAADIVVLDKDLFELDTEAIGEARARCTVMNGHVVYDADQQ